MAHTEEKGSQIAKNGFRNEYFVIDTFNAWENNSLAQEWLMAMDYQIDEIEYVKAEKIKGSYKADVQVHITIKLKKLFDCQNIQVKLVSNKKGFNQIDKRWLAKYQELWNIPQNIYQTLQYYVGELLPYHSNTRDKRRMFISEMNIKQQQDLIKWLTQNKLLILNDVIKGRGKFSAEWVLVIRKTGSLDWVLKPVNIVLNFYAQGDIEISSRGSVHIGKITMQRKGGDNGRKTANMLQFKCDPTELFLI